MKEEIKKEVVKKTEKKIIRPLNFIQNLFLLTFIISPFVAIWGLGWLAFKLFLTGVVGIMFTQFSIKVVRKSIANIIDEEQQEINASNKTPETKFQEKLEELMKQKYKKS
jgi:hypothetical protein